MLEFIARNCKYKTLEIIASLHTSRVRPHLQYTVRCCCCSPITSRTLIATLKSKQHEERLKLLSICSLENEILRSYIIHSFKILHKFENTVTPKSVKCFPSRSCYHSLVHAAGERVSAETISSFKNYVHEYIDTIGVISVTVHQIFHRRKTFTT